MRKITADDPESRSADLVAKNLEELKRLFPEAFIEGKLAFEVLRQLLGDTADDSPERYGLTWHGKKAARALSLQPSTATLLPRPEDSVDWDTSKNVFIEGDNLEVLKLLQKAYAGKIKIIYIDPPYNTGKDFVYPDDFRDGVSNYRQITGQMEDGLKTTSNSETSGRFHSDWLSMIYPRLALARTLLREDGLVFISIDDSEQERLRLVCAELFGEENFVAQIAWQNLDTIKNDAQYFSENHEYVLCYARNIAKLDIQGTKKTDKQRAYYKNRDNDPRGDYLLTPLHAKSGSAAGNYTYTFQNGQTWSPPPGTFPRFSRDTLARMESEGRIYLSPDGRTVPQRKTFWSEVGDRMPATTFWDYETYGSTRQSNVELATLLGKGVFQNPKPTKLVCSLIDLISGNEGIILDFFAGSATTAHATMLQNATDGGSRSFILVQLPEPLDPDSSEQRVAAQFCREHHLAPNLAEIAKERIRRAASKIRDENPLIVGDLGFRCFALSSSNLRAWDVRPEDLNEALRLNIDNVNADRTGSDLLVELSLKLGIELSAPIKSRTVASHTVGAVGDGALLACLDESIASADVDALADAIITWHRELAPADPSATVVVVRDSAFEDDVAKTNFAAILRQNGFADQNIRSV